MATDPGPSSWLAGQYYRFLDGIEKTGNPNAVRLSRSQARVRVDPGKTPSIDVPAWSDVIKTGPRTPVTDEDWTIQRHFERAHLPSPLSPEIQDAIRERRRIADRIRNSAIPEYQQGVTQVLTVVDNVQDAALTASVGARVSMPFLGRFGNLMAPAVIAAGKIASLLNLLNLGVIAFGVGYAAACQGPRAAIAQHSVKNLAAGLFAGLRAVLPRRAGIPVPLAGREFKGRMAAVTWQTPQGRKLAATGGSRWALARVSVGEALQLAQTASDLTGYGLSLGAVMGFIGETAYGAERALRGERVRVRSPRVNHTFADLIGSRVHELSSAALWHREQCCRALASAPFVLRDPEFFGDDLYVLTWLVAYVSVEPLMWDTQGLKWRDAVVSGLPASWTPFEARDTVTRGIIEEQGGDPDASGPWPLPGSPLELGSDPLVLELGRDIARALDRFLEAAPMDPARRFVAELSMRLCDRMTWWLEATPEWPRYELSPTAAVWESLWQADRWPIVSDPPERIAAAWAACEGYVVATGVKYIDVEVLDRIWEEHGTPLLVLLPADRPFPVEHFVPWDPETGAPQGQATGRTVEEARAELQRILDQERGKQT